MQFLNLAAYKFTTLDNLQERRRDLKAVVERLAVRGTILISSEGINLFVAASESSCRSLLEYLQRDPLLADLTTKESWTDYQPFRRMLVKIKREIIAFGLDSIQPAQRTSPKLSPQELKTWLDDGRPVMLLDTRNDYEVDLGTFKGAIDLGIHHFRDFPKAIEALPQESKNSPIVMFCTGGIRCEKAGPMMEQAGFQEVYQLDGGILNYFQQCGAEHYKGDCFVFDQRVAVTPTLEPSGAKLCFACQKPLDASELASPLYRVGVSCPSCYRTPEEQKKFDRRKRQKRLDAFAISMPGSQPYENRRPMYVAGKYAGLSLIDWLSTMHQGLTREYWFHQLSEGLIVSGPILDTANQVALASQLVKEGERFIQIEPNCIEPNCIEPNIDGAIKILHEDSAIIVIDKPNGLPSHASGRFCRNTVDYLLSQVYSPETLHLAHRLDAATSGLMVLARKHRFAGPLQQQFTSGAVDKIYLAHIHGQPAEDSFTCEAPIDANPGPSGKRFVSESGQRAITRFEVLERLENGTSIVRVVPVTGRTNQIRVHLAYLGYPILYDEMYGDRCDDESTDHGNNEIQIGTSHRGLRLHAWSLSIDHPETQERMTFVAPWPILPVSDRILEQRNIV